MEPLPSLRAIFDEHARYVIRTLRHLGIPEADVEDLAQEVFVTVQRKLPEFEGRSKLSTWLYGICLRVASDHRRRAYFNRERLDAEPLDHAAEPALDAPDVQAETARSWGSCSGASMRTSARSSCCTSSKVCRCEKSLKPWAARCKRRIHASMPHVTCCKRSGCG